MITNVDVFGLDSSIYRSGYPMLTAIPTEVEFHEKVRELREKILDEDYDDPHIKRAIRLANAAGGGHDQFLTGVLVSFDLTMSNKAWVEAERYTFLNFISSMSTMHRVAVLPIRDSCNSYVSDSAIELVEELQRQYNEIDGKDSPCLKREAYLSLLYQLPAGFELTAAMTTNYRCLKNVYAQRRNHRLPDWKVFCDWVETLPMAGQLITGNLMAEVK
jgi:hypothetical protein